VAALWAMACIEGVARAQLTIGTSSPPPALPVTTQMKKSVVFLQADCLHDFEPYIAQLTPDALAKMSAQEITRAKEQLKPLIMRLENLKQSKAKLTSGEIAMLKPAALASLELREMAKLVGKMANLTTEDIGKLAPEEIATLPADPFMGTG